MINLDAVRPGLRLCPEYRLDWLAWVHYYSWWTDDEKWYCWEYIAFEDIEKEDNDWHMLAQVLRVLQRAVSEYDRQKKGP